MALEETHGKIDMSDMDKTLLDLMEKLGIEEIEFVEIRNPLEVSEAQSNAIENLQMRVKALEELCMSLVLMVALGI